MKLDSLARRVLELEQKIIRAKQAYYLGGNPVMSDEAYDLLEAELGKICPDSPILKMVGPPMPKDSQLRKVEHSRPMGSQEKIHTVDEMNAWAASRGESEFHASFKADGGSIAAYYKNGMLDQVLTRGSGKMGEDITAGAYCFRGLPAKLSGPFNWAVRCEAVLTVDDWKELDPQMESNPRNIANGILGRLDGSGSDSITALAFDVDGTGAETEEEKEKMLQSEGFLTPESVNGSLDAVINFYKKTMQSRQADKLPYWIDGVVVKLHSVSRQAELGETNGRPKGQVAWKFPAVGEETTLLEVQWEVGATGAITPVGSIVPVRIGGTTVSRVSLSNPELISALGLTIGARVLVVKAGEIIPQISKVIGSTNTKVQIPTTCPVCAAGVIKKSNVDGSKTAVLYCGNQSCNGKKVGKILRWSGSRDILGLGEAVVRAMLDSGLADNVADILELEPNQIKNLQLSSKVTMGEKRAEGVCREIREKTASMSLPEFLGSFGTRGLGVRKASLMIRGNPELINIERWFDGSLLDATFAAAAGVPKSGVQIYEGLKEEESIIRRCLERTSIVAGPKKDNTKKTLCITGSLPSGKKKHEYESPLGAVGISLVDDVSKGLDYLVVSNPEVETGKTKKARKLGIKIISEEDMKDLIDENK